MPSVTTTGGNTDLCQSYRKNNAISATGFMFS